MASYGHVGVLRGRLTACMARPCYDVGRLQKHARNVCGALEAVVGGRHGRPLGLVGVLRGRLTACMSRPCYALGRQQKHASDICGETEAKAGERQGRPVGLVGVLHGHSMSCMTRLCYAVGSLQKHADDVGRGMTSPPLDSTHGQQRRAWHDDITALGQHTRSATLGVE